MIRTVTVVAVLALLCGCFRSEQQTQTQGVLRGTLNGQPVELKVVLGTDTQTATGVDLIAALQSTMQAVRGDLLGAVDRLKPPPLPAMLQDPDRLIAAIGAGVPKPDTLPTGTALGGAGAALAWAIAQTLAARHHKRDADEGWQRALNTTPPAERA
jgi:hypothetical protein